MNRLLWEIGTLPGLLLIVVLIGCPLVQEPEEKPFVYSSELATYGTQLVEKSLPSAVTHFTNKYVSYDTVYLYEPLDEEEAVAAKEEMELLYEEWVGLQPEESPIPDRRRWDLIYLHLRKFFDLPVGPERIYRKLILKSSDYFNGVDIVSEMAALDLGNPKFAQLLFAKKLDALFQNILGDTSKNSTYVLETVLNDNGVTDLSQYFEDNFKGRIAWKEMGETLMDSSDSQYADFWEYHLKPLGVKTILLLANKSPELVVGFTESRFLCIFSDAYGDKAAENNTSYSNGKAYIEQAISNLDTTIKKMITLFPQARTRLQEKIRNNGRFIFYDRDIYRGKLYDQNITVQEYYRYLNYYNFQKGHAAVGGGPGVMMCAYHAGALAVVAHELMHWADQYKLLIVTDDLDDDSVNSFVGHAFRKHTGSTDLFQYYTNIGYIKTPNTSSYLNTSHERFSSLDDWEKYLRIQGFVRYFYQYLQFIDADIPVGNMGRSDDHFNNAQRLVWLIGNLGWGVDGDSKETLDKSFLAYCRASKGSGSTLDQHKQGSLAFFEKPYFDHENSIYSDINTLFDSGGTVFGLTKEEWITLYSALPTKKKGKLLPAIREESGEFRNDHTANLRAALKNSTHIKDFWPESL